MRIRKAPFWSTYLAFVLFLGFGQASAQVQELAQFKNVNVPFGLKYNDLVMEKGTYDFVFLRNLPNTFLLKILKRGKTIALISGGEKVNYPAQGNLSALQRNPDIPKFAKLKLNTDAEQSVVFVIFETGKQAKSCALHKIRFKLELIK